MQTEAAGKDYRTLYKRWESGSPDSVATIRDVHGIEVLYSSSSAPKISLRIERTSP
jgi:hypothetical protein